jgi:triosephosphate isomerase
MKKIVIGNWKLNLDHLEAIQLLQKLNYTIEEDKEEKIDIVVSPSHTSLRSIQTIIDTDKLNIKLSAQDVSQFNEGAYTGEVSSQQLSKLNVKYCIVGHSERRTEFDESDETINKKIQNLIDKDITPVICFGETLEQRNSNKYLENITSQIDSAVKGLRKDKVDNLVFAYEPIWAIGTGEVASIIDVVEVISMVKENVSEKSFYNNEKIRFIYGGSLTPDNAGEILNSKIIDGALVGGSSLDVDKFVTIVNSINL